MGIDFDSNDSTGDIPSEDDVVYQIGEKKFENKSDVDEYLEKVQRNKLIAKFDTVFTETFGENAKARLMAKMSEDGRGDFEQLIEEVISRSDKNLTDATPRILIGEMLSILGEQFQRGSPLVESEMEGSFDTMAEQSVRHEEI